MKWLTNIYNPKARNAKNMLVLRDGETTDQAWQPRQQWLEDKIIGPPKATEQVTAEEMEAQGLVGVYINDSNNERSK